MSKKKTLEEIIKEFKEKFPENDYYDFSETVYIDSRSYITVYCKKHNEYFKILPNTLLKGITACSGCKKEKAEINNQLVKEKGKESFNKFLKKNYSDKYIYDIDEYDGSHSRMTFIRKSDGIVKKYTPSDLRSRFKIESKQKKRSDADPNWVNNKLEKEKQDLISLINENYPDIDTSLIDYKG